MKWIKWTSAPVLTVACLLTAFLFTSEDNSLPWPSLVVDEEGNVGIGTYTPGYALEVNGDVCIRIDERCVVKHAAAAAAGTTTLLGPSGKTNVYLGFMSDNSKYGRLYAADAAGDPKAELRARVHDSKEFGQIVLWGKPGKTNVLAGGIYDGWIEVRNKDDEMRAILTIDDHGRGQATADTFSAVVEHPARKDSVIDYPALHGARPEVYVRGTARLRDGKATITLPEHFEHRGAGGGVTVSVTPLSADSVGLAVTRSSVQGFEVQELNGGRNTYDFDWEVKALRPSHETHRIVHEKRPALKLD